MKRILFLAPNLSSGGAAKQVALLATGLPRDRFETHVCSLRGTGPFGDRLRAAGVPVTTLGWHRVFDPSAVLRLHRLVRDMQPDVIHAWRPPALRAAGLLPGRGKCQVVVSDPARPPQASLSRLDRWLLRRADRIIAGNPAEAERWRRHGLPVGKVVHVSPGVEPGPKDQGPRTKDQGQLLLACAGPLEPHKGFRDVVWAFDILRFVYEGLCLDVIGDGPERGRLEHFAHIIRAGDRVRFRGLRADVPALLARADIVWVPSHAEGGINVALEAMAAGRPVVASRLPGLADVVVDGETGFLIPPGDKAALARLTRRLLNDTDLRHRMGEAGRKRVAERFGAAEMVRRFAGIYED
jgi:glycosyltransferase involved in cell wall biosynthesis